MSLSLTPRLNYDFSLSDLSIALNGIFFKDHKESGFNNYFPNSKVYFVNHARTGLRILLSSLDIPKGSNIGVLVYNCLTVFESIKLAGYKPVFIDSTNDYKIDLDDLKRKEAKLDVLIVTHLFGISSEVESIKKIMGIKPIIEDCAHSFLKDEKGKYLGSFGDGSIFSFGHGKFPVAAEGGIVIINNKKIEKNFDNWFKDLEEEPRSIQTINIFKALLSALLMNKLIYGIFTYRLKQKVGDKADLNKKYVFHEKKVNVGFFKVFKKRLTYIEKLKTKQNNNAITVLNSFQDLKFNGYNANFMIPLRSKDPEGLINAAFNKGIEFGQHFKKSILWAKNYGYKINDCKTAERLINETVTIPCYYRLSENEINKIVDILKISTKK